MLELVEAEVLQPTGTGILGTPMTIGASGGDNVGLEEEMAGVHI